MWLFDYANTNAQSSPELKAEPCSVGAGFPVMDYEPFPSLWRAGLKHAKNPANDEHLQRKLFLVSEVVNSYPQILAWLTEGQVSRYWNLFGILVAILRLIPGPRRILWHALFKPVACHAPWQLALSEAILQEVREELNNTPRDTPLKTSKYSQGLSAVAEVAMLTNTESHNRLHAKIEKMSSGCIGVSGPRGSGKSALIRNFCKRRYGTLRPESGGVAELPGLRITVQAAVKYDARDFLVHLYTCLCKAVIADERLNPTSFLHRVILSFLIPRFVRPAMLLRGLCGAVLLASAGTLAYRSVTNTWPFSTWPEQNWELTGTVVATLMAIIIFGWRTRQALLEVRQIIALSTDAQARLDRLHFQRTDTRGFGGTLGGPLGTGLNVTGTRAFTEQVMTLPELIDDYCDFVARVVAALQQALRKPGKAYCGDRPDVRLVIGIDNMDQIEDALSANKFLTELGALFGMPNCVHIVSVSPDILAATTQRMVPLRTTAGGMFDEMIWVEPLNFTQAAQLLNRRVLGFSDSFIALCYVLSGGLPCDLLRIARSIFPTENRSTGEATKAAGTATENYLLSDIVKVADAVIRDEVQALKHRVLAHTASLDIPATSGLLRLLDDDIRPMGRNEPPRATAENIKAMITELSRLREMHETMDPLASEICYSFLIGLCFLVTVHQSFTADPNWPAGLIPCRKGDSTPESEDSSALRDLAHARRALGPSPSLASTIISKVCKEIFNQTGCPEGVIRIDPNQLT